ncbi:MAG: sulfite exporter TauE/SafE family protein [Planctomycetota bacterium]|nr:sulfite exporter TauE/SafE family protein [Planctomycetota bacterium]
MEALLPVAGIVLVAAFTQGVIGFGFGLIAMAVLPWLLGFHFALAFVAVFGIVMNATMLWRYRAHFDGRAAFPLIFGGLLGVPVGFLFIRQMDPTLATRALGIVVALYALWQLFAQRRAQTVRTLAPAARFDPVGVGLGFAGGALGAAFNTGGPPIVMYGAMRRWTQGTFKAVIQAYFLVAVAFALALYAQAGFLTMAVLEANAICLAALLLGLLVGFRVSDRLDGPTFRTIVLVALLALGIAYIAR